MKLDRSHICGYQFSTAYFSESNITSSKNKLAGSSVFHSMKEYQWRTSKFDSLRTKCMVKPTLIFEKGIHHISKPIMANLETIRVDTDLAFVHHHRNCEGMIPLELDCVYNIHDTSMQRFSRI